MFIRIEDRGGRQHAQNPPPEGQAQAAEEKGTDCVACPAPAEVSSGVVMRGGAAGQLNLGSQTQGISGATAKLASGSTGADRHVTGGHFSERVSGLLTHLTAFGWMFRKAGGSYTVENADGPQPRDVPGRWIFAAKGRKDVQGDDASGS